MAMGLDMLLNTLVKAVGLKPEVFIPQMEQLFKWNVETIKSFDARIGATEITVMTILEQNKIIIEQNTQIIALLRGGDTRFAAETLVIENQESEK